MLRIVLVGLLAAIAVALADPNPECIKLMQPHTMMCCKSLPHLKESEIETMKECFEKFKPSGLPPSGPPPGPPPCDIDTCVAKKSGILSDDGVIDKKAMLAQIIDFQKDPVVVEAMEKKCINGDITNYGTEGMCDIMKMRHCIQTQVILTCPDLDNSGHCNGLKELAEKCSMEL